MAAGRVDFQLDGWFVWRWCWPLWLLLLLLLLLLGLRWPDRRGLGFHAYAIGSGEEDFALAHFGAFPIPGEPDGEEHARVRDVELVADIEELPHLVEGDGGGGDGVPKTFL